MTHNIEGYGVTFSQLRTLKPIDYLRFIGAHTPDIAELIASIACTAADIYLPDFSDTERCIQAITVLADADSIIRQSVLDCTNRCAHRFSDDDICIYTLLAHIMRCESNIRVCALTGDKSAVMFPYKAPWLYNTSERSLTEKSLRDVFTRYFSELNLTVRPGHINLKF